MPELKANARPADLAPGKYSAGDGAILNVRSTGAAAWVVRYRHGGKYHDLGLGAFSNINRTKARKLAREARALAAQGIDPKAERAAARTAQKTFSDALQEWFDEWRHGRDPKYVAGAKAQLDRNIIPTLGQLPLAAITTPEIVAAFKRDGYWKDRYPSAKKSLQNVCQIFSRASAMGELPNGNPAADVRAGLAKVQHKPNPRRSLDYWEADRVWAWLDQETNDSVATRMHRLLITTGLRSREARFLRWDCIKTDELGRPYLHLGEDIAKTDARLVGLSNPALTILNKMRGFDSKFIFASPVARVGGAMRSRGKPLSENALYKHTTKLIEDLEVERFDPHGWRSTLRGFVKAVGGDIEACHSIIGHSASTSVSQIYDRYSDMQKTLPYLDSWAEYLLGNSDKEAVVRLIRG